MSNSQTASETSSTTRSSQNTWVPRDSTPVVDSIYRRAADLLKIDESLLRERSKSEGREELGKKPITESLQMVHYSVGDNYKPHFDFALPTLHEKGTVRFATLLLYLNEGMEGGETSFPKWVNAETQKALKVAPEKGKAVLFYSVLPDGNLDSLSLHAAKKVTEGEKWLMNLWVWNPVRDY
eukprot:scaffold36530_cov47-Attheya_sp.AAC.2